MRLLRTLLSSTELVTTILVATSYLAIPVSGTITFPPALSSNLDISQLGRVAVVGDFAAASLYDYTQQSSNSVNTNGKLSLLSRYPTGAFATLEASDAYIYSMCTLQTSGKTTGVFIGGNFTSLGGVESPGIALYNPDTSKVQAISGLSGKVNALLCDSSAGIVYIGGMFSAANTSNAVSWTSNGLKALPFVGFNGAVTSIAKEANGNIVFGGSFDGLGNSTTPKPHDGQRVPLTSATLTGSPATTIANLGNVSNIICKDPTTDGPGNAFLCANDAPCQIQATFPFGFNPTLLRLRNSFSQTTGTKTFYFTAVPLGGILNLSYVDPNGITQYCDQTCPMPKGNTSVQDFHLVNPVGMNGFQLNLAPFMDGTAAGLSDLEMYQNDIYTFAIQNFNEPNCPDVANPATVTTVGTWTTKQSTTGPDYLSNSLTGAINPDDNKVIFSPDIQQAGNYSVTLFTPGCIQDDSCSNRGRVTVSGTLGSQTSNTSPSFSVDIAQTNNFDKFDQIFLGRVDLSSSSFKPTVTVAPSTGQNGPLTIVAQRVKFDLVTTSGGLNGLFEYVPSNKTVNMNFKQSSIDSAATALDSGALVNSVITQNGLLYVGGSFHSGDYSNFFSIGSNATSPADHGLNGPVQAMYPSGNTLFVGGSFNGTINTNGPSGLNGIAAYNTASNKWTALGGGVKGSVSYIVPFQLNLNPAGKTSTTALAISGAFNQINSFGSTSAISVDNFAIWVPSKNNWLQNLNVPTIAVTGLITAGADIPNNPSLFAGSVASFDLGANGALELTGSKSLALEAFPGHLKIPQIMSTNGTSSSNATGVVAGAYYTANNKNYTVLGGHFSASGSNGSTLNNLIIIDGTKGDNVTGVASGISADSTVLAVAIANDAVFAGGSVSGTAAGVQVNGLFVYNISTSDFAKIQPQALQGDTVAVNALAAQPNTQSIYVGGSFDSAGTFPCPGLCIYDTTRNQWTSPANGFKGTVTTMTWVDNTHLLVAGNLTVNNTAMSVALYDSKAQAFGGSGTNGVPSGTITALSPASSNGSMAWIGGSSQDTPFLAKWDGSKWNTVTGLGAGSIIRGLQVFTLTKNHDKTPLLDQNNALLVFGSLNITSFGQASAALFNGTTFTPFLLTNNAQGSPGSVAGIFVANPLNFFKSANHLALGFIVLIGLAISLALIFLIIGAGMAAEILRRRAQGYVAAPSPPPGNDNLQRIPPEELLGGLTQTGRQGGRGWAPEAETGKQVS
ncbi:hypothetical protein BT63DRAFT_449524 [Microthyrium microscopicum]|uniref:Cellular morphogenesis protein n=1 Tax=Microthyrium microscopicum TaxID=703497 RepID=A0A6A6URZ9_9PEZI|nr:hypothetical protein BT63DRAFT_449524 [Microthyrium microscopicum]